jgi:hypothetical protein
MQMRPMTTGEILDGAFKIYRGHFVPMFLAALLSYAPFVLIGVALALVVGAGESTTGLVAAGLSFLISLPLMILGFGVSWGSVTFQASEAYMGRPVTLGGGIRQGFRRVLPLFAAMVMTAVLAMIGFLFFIVPLFIVLAMFFAVIPAVVVENRGPLEAMSRSRTLSRGSRTRILGVMFLAALIAALPGYAVTAFSTAQTVMSAGAEPSVAMIIGTEGMKLFLGALTMPFSMAVTVLLYYDRRIRVEALDVHMMAEGIPAMAV